MLYKSLAKNVSHGFTVSLEFLWNPLNAFPFYICMEYIKLKVYIGSKSLPVVFIIINKVSAIPIYLWTCNELATYILETAERSWLKRIESKERSDLSQNPTYIKFSFSNPLAT